jgi:hypothetical protein
MSGRTISRYQILEKLDEGGSGAIYRAQGTRPGREPPALGTLDRRQSWHHAFLVRAPKGNAMALLFPLLGRTGPDRQDSQITGRR